jgi:hypothetical protein
MSPLEILKSDITLLNDADLRELVGMLCEAELKAQSLPVSGVFWGGSQTAADSGLDAEVKLKIKQPKPDFVPSSHTGIQVKKNSMSAKACFNEMHQNGKLRLDILASGRCHEAINDEKFSILIGKLIGRDSGIVAALRLLVMRFHNKRDSNDHSEKLLKVSRLALIKIFEKTENRKQKMEKETIRIMI